MTNVFTSALKDYWFIWPLIGIKLSYETVSYQETMFIQSMKYTYFRCKQSWKVDSLVKFKTRIEFCCGSISLSYNKPNDFAQFIVTV